MSNKILIIGDPFKGGQERNIDSMYLAFEPIANELNCKLDIYKSTINKIEYTETEWVQKWCLDLEDYEQELIEKIEDVDIVIGFELRDKHIRYLKKKNLKKFLSR